MSKKEMNLYKRCKNIFKSHGVDMGGGGDSSGGGEGLQYDFVIVSEDGATYSFEKGSYNDIVSKIKSGLVTGITRLCSDRGMQYSTNQVLSVQYICTDNEQDTWVLLVRVFGAETPFLLTINEDNTISIG